MAAPKPSAPKPVVYDTDFAKRAREATQKATDNTRKGR